MDFAHLTAPQSAGMDPTLIAEIQRTVRTQVADGLTPGTQVVVARHGQVVVDLALGTARLASQTDVTPDTLFYSWSVAKPITAMAVHLLIERRKLCLDDPIAKVWPEFGKHGKERVSVRHVLAHRGGFPLTPPSLQWQQYADWDAAVHAMEDAPLAWQPGSAIQYHPLNFGWTLGEVVRRVDGRPIDQFAREEFFVPLGMDHSYLRLPSDKLEQTAELTAPESFVEAARAISAWNLPLFRQAVIPAAGLHTTARDMARFYQMMLNGGEWDGKRVLKPESIAQARKPSYTAGERDLEWNQPAHFGHGLHLGGYDESIWGGTRSTERTFGHNGWATNVSWADLDRDVLCIILNNGMLPDVENEARLRAVCDLVMDACRTFQPVSPR
jgi:CubicO group peptidase (beta-lactamase class C family)